MESMKEKKNTFPHFFVFPPVCVAERSEALIGFERWECGVSEGTKVPTAGSGSGSVPGGVAP